MLRIVAAKHYVSDVVLGGIVGALVGYFIPVYVFPRRLPMRLDLESAGPAQRSYW